MVPHVCHYAWRLAGVTIYRHGRCESPPEMVLPGSSRGDHLSCAWGETSMATTQTAHLRADGWIRAVQADSSGFRSRWKLVPGSPTDEALVADGAYCATTDSRDISGLSDTALDRLVALYHRPSHTLTDDEGLELATTLASLPRRLHAGIDLDTGNGSTDDIEAAVKDAAQRLAAEWTRQGFGTLRLDRSSGAGGGAHLVTAVTSCAHPWLLQAFGQLVEEMAAALDIPTSRSVPRDKDQRPAVWIDLAAANKRPEAKGGMWRLVGSCKPGKAPKAPWGVADWTPGTPDAPHNTPSLNQELMQRASAIADAIATADANTPQRIRVPRAKIATMAPEALCEQDHALMESVLRLRDDFQRTPEQWPTTPRGDPDQSGRDWAFGNRYLDTVVDPHPIQLARLLLALPGGKASQGRRGAYLARTIDRLFDHHHQADQDEADTPHVFQAAPPPSAIIDALHRANLPDLAKACGGCGRRSKALHRVEANPDTGETRRRMRSCQHRLLCRWCAAIAARSDAERVRDTEEITRWTIVQTRIVSPTPTEAIENAHRLRSKLIGAARGVPALRLTPYARFRLRPGRSSTAEVHVVVGHLGDHQGALRRVQRCAARFGAEVMHTAEASPAQVYTHLNTVLAGVGRWAADADLAADTLRLARRSQVFRANNQLRDMLPEPWSAGGGDGWTLTHYVLDGDKIAGANIDILAPALLVAMDLQQRHRAGWGNAPPVILEHQGREIPWEQAETLLRSLRPELEERWPTTYAPGFAARASP